MNWAREAVSWLLISILILLSAKLFIDSEGESVYSWAILLMIPIPLFLIISFQTKRQTSGNDNAGSIVEENDEISEIQKKAEDPLEIGFDIPIL
ncbi:MAG: hypothetical protein QF610_02045 [Candidatus Thalassarchaeaceae archaeon]|nr:hypothetical protein [Candidatus Thalassarchaeaceae archaeon]|tara:strand:- start:487 stop:768 length:282 start_codon:yes stop_codon:yes gene_type:complete